MMQSKMNDNKYTYNSCHNEQQDGLTSSESAKNIETAVFLVSIVKTVGVLIAVIALTAV